MSFHQAGPEGLLAPDLVKFKIEWTERPTSYVFGYDPNDAAFRFYQDHPHAIIETIEEV